MSYPLPYGFGDYTFYSTPNGLVTIEHRTNPREDGYSVPRAEAARMIECIENGMTAREYFQEARNA